MFQMDSNSGQPFFGVNLLPSRKTAQNRQAPKPDSSSMVAQLRNGDTNPRPPVATVADTRTTEPSLLERLKLKRPPERIQLSLPTSEEDEVEGPVEEFR
jgi:hypothetical protein